MLRTEAVFALCGFAALLGPILRREPPPVAPVTCPSVVAVVGSDASERLACPDDPALDACTSVVEGRRYRACQDVGAIRGPVLVMRGLPIDVNEAIAEDLRALPGVGEGLARRLVEGRRDEPYCSAFDLARVGGIGQKRATELGSAFTFKHPLCDDGPTQ